MAPTLDDGLRGLGALTLLYIAFQALQGLHAIYAFFLRGGKRLKKYGEWAIVTGATDGIGRAYAFELAKQGLNVLLLSRTEAKLKEVQKEIKEKYPKVEVDYLTIDFSCFDTQARDQVKARITNMDVGVLINNVGMSYPFTKYFHELQDDEVEGLIELNINSTVWMTRAVLGDEKSGMIQRRRGAIVNTSSGAGRATSPLLCEYSGAKSFIEMFSKGLKAELESFGITVQCQAPLYVATKLAKIRKTSVSVPSPGAYSRSAVAHIGYEDSVSPYWSHAIQLWALRQLPEWLNVMIVRKMHLAVRKAGLKKEAQRAAEAKKGE